MKNQSLFLFFIFMLTLASCRVTKKINQAIAPQENSELIAINKNYEDSVNKIRETFEQLKAHNIGFKTFNAKIKVESSGSKGYNPDITAVVRIIKDSAIWMSLSASILNVEVYRVLITKDSIVLLNKQNKEVNYRTLDYLQEVAEIPFDFQTLQDFIIGNPVFMSDSIVAYKRKDEMILMTTIDRYFKNLFSLKEDSKLMLHCKMDDVDPVRSRTADITYSVYQNNGEFFFSTEREITVSEKNKLDVKLDFKQYEFNKDLSVSFTVPKNYTSK
jgi:hypothetical protein